MAKYHFTGGDNDADYVPVDRLIAAATAVLKREGSTLATYGLENGPLGYRPLREFLVDKLQRTAGISHGAAFSAAACTPAPATGFRSRFQLRTCSQFCSDRRAS